MTLFDLENRLNSLILNHARPKYLHPRTIKNFIYHFNSLGVNEKEFVLNHLDGYLHEIEETGVLTRDECADIFNIYVLPISKIYERDLGFAPMVHFFVTLVWFFCISFLMVLLNVSAILYYLLAFILLVYYGRIYSKRKQRKVYGLMF